MEDSISRFPIIIQHQPGRERGRRHASSVFVRAHVMGRYHRQRRAGLSPDRAATPVLRGDAVDERAVGESESRSVGTGARDEETMEAGTVSSAGSSDCADPVVSRCGRGWNGVTFEKELLRKKRRNERAVVLAGRPATPATPSIVGLRWRDPREQDSSRFMEVFRGYTHMLEKRHTTLDPLSRSWLPIAFTDLALFHAILFNFSQHLYALCSMDHEKPSLLKHKVDAIHHISARMESPALACSDTVIASVLCLVSHEFLHGDALALQAHLKGLRRIVAVRGGLHTLGLDGTLRTIYLSYELLFATVFKSWATILSPLSSISHHTSSPPGKPRDIFTLGHVSLDSIAHGLDTATLEILSILKQFITHQELLAGSEINLNLQNHGCFSGNPEIEPQVGFKDENITSCDHISTSLRLAASLHFSAPHPSTTTAKLVTQLKHHLNETIFQSFWHPVPGALLWCLIVGMRASKETQNRPWFVANVIRTTVGLAFEQWEGLREILCRLSVLGVRD